MAYKDTFIGLADNEAIAGDTWDEGGLAWHASTPMLGNGAGGLKASAGSPYLGGFMAPVDAVGMAVRFKPLAGWDGGFGLLHIYYGGTEAISESASGNSARASLSGGYLAIRNLVDNAISEVGYSITADNEYWLEICVAAVAGGKTLYARLSNHTAGARGAVIAAAPLEFAAALPGKSVHLYTENPNRTYIEVREVEALTAPFTLDGAAPDTAPGAPTIGTATVTSSTSASVTCTAPESDGGDPITSYVATSTPGGITGTSATTTISVPGLTTNTAYTFKVHAVNGVGLGPQSAASNSVTPIVVAAPTGTVTTQHPPDGQSVRMQLITANATGGAYTLARTGGGSIGPTAFTVTADAADFTVTGIPEGTWAWTITISGQGGGPVAVNGAQPFTIVGVTGGGEPGGEVVAATAVTLSGPSTCTIGVASSNYTVNTNGTRAGSVVVTPAATGGGTFSPTSVTLAAGTAAGTFTYTAASAGAKSISVTNNGGLTNPAAVTTTASAAADTTKPTLIGVITEGNVTSSSFTHACPVASDNVAVTGYESSIDGGTNYTNRGTARTATESGRPASTAHAVRWRAYDAAGLRSDPLSLTIATSAAAATVTGVSVSPTAAAGSQTFTASVSGTNSPSQAVTWAASAGTISSSGVFTAPAATASEQTITITAQSVADTTKTGTATVTIAAVVEPIEGIQVALSCTVNFGGTNRLQPSDPYFKNSKWYVPKDPDDERYYKFGLAKDLTESGTTATLATAIFEGVEVLVQPVIQGSDVVIKLGGLGMGQNAENFCTIRIDCANGEQIDRTMHFVREDH
ncbi:MAG: fibronectin type III domain-containing protein [Telluria sp.]